MNGVTMWPPIAPEKLPYVSYFILLRWIVGLVVAMMQTQSYKLGIASVINFDMSPNEALWQYL